MGVASSRFWFFNYEIARERIRACCLPEAFASYESRWQGLVGDGKGDIVIQVA